MNKRSYHIVVALLLYLTASLPGVAQSLKYAGGGSMGDNKFQLVYELTGARSAGGIIPPAIDGAKCIYASGAEKIGESSSVVVVNGKVVENTSGGTYRYTLTYKAEKTGRLKVGVAQATANGHKVTAPGLTVAVSGHVQRGPSIAQQVAAMSGGPVNMADPFTQTANKPISNKDLYVRIEMSKPKVYEQQAVVCTIKLYTKFPIRPEIIPLKQPSFTGFLIEEIQNVGQVNIENVGGQNYYTAVLKKCILYPQQSGTLTINSGEFDITPVQRDVYVGLNSAIAVPHDTKLRVKSNSASVHILPLPNPRPAGFTGAVGSFSVKTQVSPAQLKTFQPATFTYVVTGSGNIKYIKAPDVKFPKEFDTYDPQNKINTSAEGNDVRGTVTFTYQFIPQYVGKFKIPASDFVYFNPGTGRYETIHVPALTLDVAKGAGKPSSHYKKMQDMMTDINALHKGDLNVSRQHSYYIAQPGYWLWFLVPALLLAAVVVYCRKLLRERADVKLMRTKRASKLAQKRLKRAKKYMAASDANAFYAEVLNATWGYLGDKLTIPVSELSKDNIDSELEKYGVDADLRTATLELLDKCEFAQYAPQLASGDLKTVFDQAASLMDRLESVKRKKNIAQS